MGQVKRHRPIQKSSVLRHKTALPLPGITIYPEDIEKYLKFYQAQGHSEGTLQSYRQKLERLYADLPEDKTIQLGFMDHWRKETH